MKELDPKGMTMNWWLIPILLGLVVGCAAPRPPGGVAFKVKAGWEASGQDRAALDTELRRFLAESEHGSNLTTAATAVKAGCDAVLWNIENSETIGFKKVMLRMNGGQLDFSVRSFAQGELSKTDEGLDVAIMGPGFFELELPNGTKGYTRDGSFRFQSSGRLASVKGYSLAGMEPLPFRAGTIEIAADGTVKHLSSAGQSMSRIRVVDFPNPAGLELNREGLFLETLASGAPETARLSNKSGATSALMQGYVEMSNVKLVEEMVTLMRLMEWRRSVRELVSAAAAGGGPR